MTTGSLIQPVKLAVSASDVTEAAAQTDTDPSQAQQEAGNYRKGKVTIHGLDISIENPKGSIRSGTSSSGRKWQTTMHSHYGYIRETRGADSDHLDIFIGPDPTCELIHVVNQVKPDGSFDEHKILVGWSSEQAARAGYLANYETGWQGLGSIRQMTLSEFKNWIREGHHTKAAGIEGEQRGDTQEHQQDENVSPATGTVASQTDSPTLTSEAPADSDLNNKIMERFSRDADKRFAELRAQPFTLGVYVCPLCGGEAHNGDPASRTRYKGSGKCADCNQTFSIVGMGLAATGRKTWPADTPPLQGKQDDTTGTSAAAVDGTAEPDTGNKTGNASTGTGDDSAGDRPHGAHSVPGRGATDTCRVVNIGHDRAGSLIKTVRHV